MFTFRYKSIAFLIAVRLATTQCAASYFSYHYKLSFLNTTSTYIGVEGVWEWRVAMKWWVTANLSNILAEMA